MFSRSGTRKYRSLLTAGRRRAYTTAASGSRFRASTTVLGAAAVAAVGTWWTWQPRTSSDEQVPTAVQPTAATQKATPIAWDASTLVWGTNK